jgi:hypothetical protein
MNRMEMRIFGLAMLMLSGGLSVLSAQMPTGTGLRGLPGRPAGAGGVEAVLRLRERLELSDQQAATLESLRQARVQERSERLAVRAELRSRLATGQLDRAEASERVRALRTAAREAAERTRQQVRETLTEVQLDSLARLSARARAFAAGRASVLRRGGRAWPHGRQGLRPRRGGRYRLFPRGGRGS